MKKNRCALAYANAPLGTQWGKRILSTLLAVVLCVGLLPGAAFAADTYTHADVNTVLDRVVKNQTTVGDGDTAYDVDKDGKLTSWDAKRILDDVPAIKVNAMRLTTFDGVEETSGGTYADWVSLEIKDGTLTTTKINEFSGTIANLFDTSSYPVAGALNEGKLVVSMSHPSDNLIDYIPVQVDPDSFVARELAFQTETGSSIQNSYNWYDATTLSDGRLLSVYRALNTTGTGNKVRFSLMDGEKLLASSEPEAPEDEDAPYLVGIAATGEKVGDSEILYGITEWGALYRFTLTEPNSDEQTLSIGGFEQFGVLDGYNTNDKYLTSASLLYDTASGYLLAAVTYRSSGVDTSALYLIDPDDPNDYVTVTLGKGVELNSLYQYEQKSTEGVQVYLTADQTSVKVDNTIKATAEAYQYSTDTAGLVTNEPLTSVTWSSSNPTVAKVENDGTVTGLEPGKATITATATTDKGSDSKSFEVTVNPDTGAKVGALLNTSRGSAWVEIDLNSVDGNQNLTGITVKNEIKGLNLVGGGYAQGKLWGAQTKALYSFDVGTYEQDTSTITLETNDYAVDITGAPKNSDGIPYGDGQTIDDPAYPVLVTNSGWIGLLKEGELSAQQLDEEGVNEIRHAAIAYVGDLTAKQVREFTSQTLENCADTAACHVYYALSRDTNGGATLRQIIFVPQVSDDGTLSYSRCATTIGTVAEFTGNLTDDDGNITVSGIKSTSMDFLKTNDGFGLLVARSNLTNNYNSIWYIDLAKYLSTSTRSLSASTRMIGKLEEVNGVSALYHTGNVTLSDTQILSIAGWKTATENPPQSAPVAAPAISVLSDEGASGSDASTPIEVSITANQPATNGKWTVTYPAGKMTLDAVSKDAGIVYYKTNDDDENGTVTLAFASRDAIKAGNALFTLTFTGDGCAEDVKITCDELNQPASKPSGGGGGGGSTGSATSPVTPAQPDNGSVSVDKKNAAQGDTVTITVEPDEGYVPGTVKVVDKDGKELPVKDLGGGKYSFVMPTGKVDVRVTFAPATGGFTDVPTDAYYREAVLWAVEKGVTNGVSDTLFGPDQACTRAQIVTFLWRAAGSPEPTAAGGFTDVPADAYYAKAVAWAVENGITTGVAEGVFAPDATCTRAQSVTFLFRALDGTAGTGSSFTDVPADAWYAAAVAWAVEKGVTNGISESLFGPDGDCTRAQIVTFLWRAMK